jgi:signal transduction histidine kinase
MERHAVDVGEVVTDRVATWHSLAEERGVTLTTAVAPVPPVLAASGALEQILDNYLDNAIEVAPAGSAVEVLVAGGGGTVTVHVLDRGPGLTDEQRAHAFERFWRAPDAGPDGSGLGLTIVARLAAASGATVALASRPGGGLDATVSFGAATDER